MLTVYLIARFTQMTKRFKGIDKIRVAKNIFHEE